MKQIIAILFLTFIFSCKETEEKTLNVINKHNNERTLADLIVTTPTTLSSSTTYGIVEIRNGGSINVTNNSTINCIEFRSVVNHIYATFLDIQQGSTFNINSPSISTTINPLTTIHVRGVFFHRWGMFSYGNIIVHPTGLYKAYGNIQIYQGQFLINGGEVNTIPLIGSTEMFAQGIGIIKFENCGKLNADRIAVLLGSPNRWIGKGRIKTRETNLRDVLTSSSTLILCSQYFYYPEPQGSVGSAYVSCLKQCFEF